MWFFHTHVDLPCSYAYLMRTRRDCENVLSQDDDSGKMVLKKERNRELWFQVAFERCGSTATSVPTHFPEFQPFAPGLSSLRSNPGQGNEYGSRSDIVLLWWKFRLSKGTRDKTQFFTRSILITPSSRSCLRSHPPQKTRVSLTAIVVTTIRNTT